MTIPTDAVTLPLLQRTCDTPVFCELAEALGDPFSLGADRAESR